MSTTWRETLPVALRGDAAVEPMENAPMSACTTLRLGGPADLLCEPSSPEGLMACLRLGREHGAPVTVIGNGSNLLVRDGGIRGLVIRIGDRLADLSAPEPLPDGRFLLRAQAGASLQKLCNAAAAAGLAGLEFASGIPGTLGGAMFMNAGAYGGEMRDVVREVSIVCADGATRTLDSAGMRFGYRKSALMDMPPPTVVVSVAVALTPGDPAAIREAMRGYAARRREKQPIQSPSCGSTFKRPQGHFAGTLIEGCGLKGFRIGGASVSTLHAGFLLNDGLGTSADYLALIAHVQRVVREQTGVSLEPEVRVLGEDTPVSAL